MKLSDYVARFLQKQGIRHVFAISGGASVHLIHSLAETDGITFVCPQHEQAGAMAADAYARVTGNLGAAVATSGPGATNMITGVCCAYYDSVPVIYITGQVATFRLKRDSGVRQLGFQETDVVEMYRPITKYAVMLEDPQRIRYELEKAVAIAKSGRPGPVLIDIPDNLQREQIDPDTLEGYVPPQIEEAGPDLAPAIERVLELIERAERPVIIIGWGVYLAGGVDEARRFVRNLGFPLVPTWATVDFLPSTDPLVVGTFGTHGTRHANFAVQNADLLIGIGTRLDTHETGGLSGFAREATKVVVDVDACELKKFRDNGRGDDVLVRADAKDFLEAILPRTTNLPKRDIEPWLQRIAQWKRQYPVCAPSFFEEKDVNPYVFVKALSQESREGDVIFIDTGCAIAWMMQGFESKPGQRLFHDFNNTAMGYALPASIGASLALDGRPITCVTGDGSLQMNIQELATVLRHKLPIRIFLLNNHGYSMIQQTQDQWLGSKYVASSVEGGLAFPDFSKVAAAYGYPVVDIMLNADVRAKVHEVMQHDGPVFCNVELRPEHRVIPQVKYGRAIEDGEPLLDRKEFLENMIVKPDRASLA